MTAGVAFVIFGATGHLARTKLLPALANVVMGQDFDTHAVVGVGVSPRSDADFKEFVRSSLLASDLKSECIECFLGGTFTYRSISEPGAYVDLGDTVRRIEAETELSGNRILYLAVPPSQLDTTIDGIEQGRLHDSNGWTRLVVEKPFGTDMATATASNQLIHRVFAEEQVYRIDHYLGKETVRNLLVFRFANALFEQTWNRRHIESVEITVAESDGVGERAGYYDESGAVRDMVQNHLTQILTLIAMEPPVSMTADAVRSEKVKVLHAGRRIDASDAVLGRYVAGEAADDGEPEPGYLDEPGVDPDSITPTFAAMRVYIDNWRWQGVPFYLRTGKRMSGRVTQVVVRYHKPPVCLFDEAQDCPIHQNILILRLQPDEGFKLFFDVKQPGDDGRIEQIPLSVRYDDVLADAPSAYETLLADVLEGDQTLFVRSDEVEASWRLYAPLLERTDIGAYTAGSDGPVDAGGLITTYPNVWTAL